MKLRKIISAFLALGIVATATPAFAADGDSFQVGTPYDITAGESTDALVAGHVIAVPVEIVSTTGGLSSYDIKIQYDNTYVTPGYDMVNESSMWDTLDELGTQQGFDTNNDTKVLYITKLGTYRGSRFTAAGTIVYNPAYGSNNNKVAIAWANSTSVKVNTNLPEAYVIFTVLKDTDVNALNTEVFSVDSADCNLADSPNGKTAQANVANTVNKANACVTAFQVDVDNDALANSGFWIQKLYAKVGDTTQPLTICNNTDGTATYSFPTRILTNTTGNADLTVDIYATVTTDEAGTENATDVKVGTFNLTADGTATNYGTATTITGINK